MPNPRIVVEFENESSVKFQVSFEQQPTEGQFQIAGEELMTIGRILREMRINQQLKPTVKVDGS